MCFDIRSRDTCLVSISLGFPIETLFSNVGHNKPNETLEDRRGERLEDEEDDDDDDAERTTTTPMTTNQFCGPAGVGQLSAMFACLFPCVS